MREISEANCKEDEGSDASPDAQGDLIAIWIATEGGLSAVGGHSINPLFRALVSYLKSNLPISGKTAR